MVIDGNATNISVCLSDVSAEEWKGWPMYYDSVYLAKSGVSIITEVASRFE